MTSPDLTDGQSQHRMLLTFAPSAEHPDARAQREALDEAAASLREHGVMRVEAFAEGDGSADGAPLPAAAAATMRERLHVAADTFAVVLLGKDGLVKLRSEQPVPAAEINRVIAAMPAGSEEQQDQVPPPEPPPKPAAAP